MAFWTLNYQPLTGDMVTNKSVDTSTTEGRADLHSELDAALDADATQIQLLLDLMGGGE